MLEVYFRKRSSLFMEELVEQYTHKEFKKLPLVSQFETLFAIRNKRANLDYKLKNQITDQPNEIYVAEKINTRDSDYDLAEYVEITKPMVLATTDMEKLESAKSRLDMEFPWLEKTTRRLLDELMMPLFLGKEFISLKPVMLLGDPGVGKTRYVQKFAAALGVPIRKIDAAGSDSSTLLKGTTKGYRNARPTVIADFLLDTRAPNLFVLLDDIDKTGTRSDNGNFIDALHQFLEPEASAKYFDEFLLTNLKLSYVNWIATANRIDHLPGSFLSRFVVIEVEGPKPDALASLIYGVRQDLASHYDVPIHYLPMLNEVEMEVLEKFVKRNSLRAISRMIKKLITDKLQGRFDPQLH